MHLPTEALESLPNGALMRLLEEAEEKERLLSEERRALHGQLDEADGVSSADPGSLAALHRAERTLSEQRLELHLWITELRMERARRVSGLRPQLKVAE